ncbi:hypothetical protein TWF730_007202 [Orbilia blumenaviensis]|uniref:Uncharacterized protein n=1 Tax=Orbilia blumenaviensis TaxID=1796055 RepID=A0AAV9V725_9PEZI
MTSSTDEIDPLVLQNRIAVAAAQRRKLAESLLRPPTAEELKNEKSAEQIAAEEEELWRPRPPTLGAGHPIPTSTSATETYNREDDLLRRRLLGRSIMKDARQRHLERTKHQHQQPRQPSARSREVRFSDLSDDDDGDGEEQTSRGAIGKKSSKKRKFTSEDKKKKMGEGREEEEGKHHTKAGAVDVRDSGSGSDSDGGNGGGGGFVSLTAKPATATPKIKKVKKEHKIPGPFRVVNHGNSDDEPDTKGTSVNTTNPSPSKSPSQQVFTGEKIVVVGEDKKRKKKKKKKKNKVLTEES